MGVGDWRRKVASGDTFHGFPAPFYNSLQDVSTASARGRTLAGGGPADAGQPEGLIYIKNSSDATVNRFGVLGISGVLIDDQKNLNEFKNDAALTGATPLVASHTGKFVIAAETIGSNVIGRAWLFGYCPVQINMNNASDPFADVMDSDTTQLNSGAAGAAQIIWAQSGTGKQWAIVRFGVGAGVPIQFGYLVYDWTPGSNSVTLQPCQSATNNTAILDTHGDPLAHVTASILIPTASTCPSFAAGPASGKPILAYKTEGGITYLINPPLIPVPTLQYQGIFANTAAGSPYGADFVRAH